MMCDDRVFETLALIWRYSTTFGVIKLRCLHGRATAIRQPAFDEALLILRASLATVPPRAVGFYHFGDGCAPVRLNVTRMLSQVDGFGNDGFRVRIHLPFSSLASVIGERRGYRGWNGYRALI